MSQLFREYHERIQEESRPDINEESPEDYDSDWQWPDDYDGPGVYDDGSEIQSNWLSPEIAGGNPDYLWTILFPTD